MRRLLFLGVLIYGLFLLGLAARLADPLVLAIPLVVYLGAALIFGPQEARLSATRTLSAQRVAQGEAVTVKLVVTNDGPALEEVVVTEVVPRGLTAEGNTRAAASLGPGAALELEYTVRGQRGQFEFSDVRVAAAEHLGLFGRQLVLTAPASLAVMPDTMKLRPVAIRPFRTRAHAGPVPGRVGGSGVEFFGVREYRPGDPQRWINWRKSARHVQDLLTNEFEQERIADVGLILDARERSNLHAQGESLFEHSVQATAALAASFLSSGDRVALLIYGAAIDWTFPGYGKLQRERILQALVRARTGDSQVFETLDYVPTRLFPARSQIVFVSPLWDNDLPMLVRLRALGYQVMAVSPDPVAFELAGLPAERAGALGTRIARLERGLTVRRLRQAGVHLVDWQVEKPLDQALLASLGRRPDWTRNIPLEGAL